MLKKFSALLMIVSVLSLTACQKQVPVQNTFLPLPPSIENIKRTGTGESLKEVAFIENALSVVWKDGENVYPPFILTEELNLPDGTRIWIEDNKGHVQLKREKAYILENGQTLNLETNTIENI